MSADGCGPSAAVSTSPVPPAQLGDHGTQGDPGYHGKRSSYLRRLKLIHSGDTEELDRKMDEIMGAVKRLMK